MVSSDRYVTQFSATDSMRSIQDKSGIPVEWHKINKIHGHNFGMENEVKYNCRKLQQKVTTKVPV